MRYINKIIVHCTATPENRDIKVDELRRWHVEDNGWNDIGYHWVIELDGSLKEGRKEYFRGAHTAGYNKDSIGVVYVGGCDKNMNPKDTRTKAQKKGLISVLNVLKNKYPKAEIIGHRDVANKACPSFDAKEEYKQVKPTT